MTTPLVGAAMSGAPVANPAAGGAPVIIALPNATCPHCHTPLNQAVGLADPTEWPRAGDFTLCYGCSSFLQFADNYRLVVPDARELKALLDDTANLPIRRRIRTALRAAIKPGRLQPSVDALVRDGLSVTAPG